MTVCDAVAETTGKAAQLAAFCFKVSGEGRS